MVIIYPSGSYIKDNSYGDWQIKSDGRLEVVVDYYTIYYTLSDDFNQLICNEYSIGNTNYSTGYILKYDRFGNNSINPIGRSQRIQQRKIEVEAQESIERAKEEESNRIREEKIALAKQQQEEELNEHISAGKELYYNGNYEGAVLEFEKTGYTKIDEFRAEFVKSYSNIANDYFSKGKFVESKETFIKANEISDNANQFNNYINQCNIEIANQLESEGDTLLKEGKFDVAIILYEQLKDNNGIKDIDIDKKIAKCYEKKGDSYFNSKKFDQALKSYQTSNQVYKNIYVSSKIENTQSKLKTIEELKYKFEVTLSFMMTFNNKSNSNFQEIYGNSIGFDLNGAYRLNRFLTIGLGYNSSTYKNKSGIKLLNALAVDTAGVIVDDEVAIYEDRDLTISSYYLNTSIGYFIGMVNPFISLQISRNNSQILQIQYLEEANGTSGGYYDRALTVNSTTTGYSIGGGVRIGNNKWRFDLKMLKSFINTNKLLNNFSNIRLQVGGMFVF